MSKRIELTEALIASAQPKADVWRNDPPTILWDSVVPGFGLEVKTDGAKRFICQCETRQRNRRRGKQHKTRFGTASIRLPDGEWFFIDPFERRPRLWPLDYARQHAREWLSQAKNGKVPENTKWYFRDDPRPSPEPRPQPAKKQPFDNSRKIEDVAERFIHFHLYGTRSPNYARDASSVLRTHVVAHWKGRDIGSLTRKEISTRLREVKASGRPVQANRVKAVLGKLFNWAMNNEGWPESNPCAGMDRVTRETPRDRELSDRELAAVWGASALALDYPWRQFARMLMLTGQRVREVAGIEWTDLDLDAATWTIPRDKTKAKREHIVPLSSEAVEVLEECKKQQRLFGPRGDYVFMSGVNGNNPIRGLVKPKMRLDARCGVTNWCWHDLRRTCASGMARLEVQPHVIAAVLNHAPQGITAQVYNRYSYVKEKRRALGKWAQHVVATAKRYPVVALTVGGDK
jgi:integrase